MQMWYVNISVVFLSQLLAWIVTLSDGWFQITYSASFIGCQSNMTASTTTKRRDDKKHEKKWSAPRSTWGPHSNASTQTLNMHRVAKGLIMTLNRLQNIPHIIVQPF